MDLHNNDVGIRVFWEHPFWAQCEDGILDYYAQSLPNGDATRDDRLYWIPWQERQRE